MIVTGAYQLFIFMTLEKIIDVFSGKSIVSNYNEIERQQLDLLFKKCKFNFKGNYILFLDIS